jgi:hypothetical protein
MAPSTRIYRPIDLSSNITDALQDASRIIAL